MCSAPRAFRHSTSLFAPLALLIPRRVVNPCACPAVAGLVSGLSSPTRHFEISIYRTRAIVRFLDFFKINTRFRRVYILYQKISFLSKQFIFAIQFSIHQFIRRFILFPWNYFYVNSVVIKTQVPGLNKKRL